MQVVYITKYALTAGLIEAQVKKIDARMVTVKSLPRCGLNGESYFHKPDWYATKAEALVRVSEMIKKKEKSLVNKLAELHDFRLKEESWIN